MSPRGEFREDCVLSSADWVMEAREEEEWVKGELRMKRV